ALAVLDKGLKEHPGYLSALVAKGRCHLELGEGEEARVVLERVVKQDATQMVANKLLVRAYLETGDPVRARERLDLYSLLNDSDPEIEELRRRIRQLEKPVAPEPPAPSPEADPFALDPPPAAGPDDPTMVIPLPLSTAAAPAAPAPRAPEVFDLDPPAPAPLRTGGDDIFQLEPAAPPAPLRPAAAPVPSAVRAEDLFELEPLPAPATAPVPGPASEETEPPEDEGLLFQGLSTRDSRRRYLDALGAEGLFSFEPPAPVLAEPAPFAPPPPVSLVAEPFAPGP
ncbi:MAG: tetratricopeptide repeat protein, partial [Acidobacteriota bacterium]